MNYRDISALIADRIMGWKIEGDVAFSETDFFYMVPDLGGFWAPSLSLQDAWDVVEKLKAKHNFEIQYLDNSALPEPYRQDPVWIAHFSRGLSKKASTAPLAICLAALEAEGIEVSGD